MERQILDSQERAFWNVHRPPVRNHQHRYSMFRSCIIMDVAKGWLSANFTTERELKFGCNLTQRQRLDNNLNCWVQGSLSCIPKYLMMNQYFYSFLQVIGLNPLCDTPNTVIQYTIEPPHLKLGYLEFPVLLILLHYVYVQVNSQTCPSYPMIFHQFCIFSFHPKCNIIRQVNVGSNILLIYLLMCCFPCET